MTTTIQAPSRAFPTLDERTAPEAARPALAAARQAFGMLPSPLRRYALSPTFLAASQGALAAFEGTSLAHLEREVVALTVVNRNDCHYCRALHRGLLRRMGVDAPLREALVANDPLDDPRLEALRRFTLAVLDSAGDVADDAWATFLAAGFDRAQALEVVLGVGAYTMTTLANRLTQSPLE